MRFGIIDFTKHEDLKETLYGVGPQVMVLKDGIIYHNSPMQDSYFQIYELIEKGVPEDTTPVFKKYPVGGRITVVGLYLTYWKRETLAF